MVGLAIRIGRNQYTNCDKTVTLFSSITFRDHPVSIQPSKCSQANHDSDDL